MKPLIIGLILLLCLTVALRGARRRRTVRWVASCLVQSASRRARRGSRGRPVHALICIADHFEPGGEDVPPELADARLGRWVRDYPGRFACFRDSDGRPPRHTFFYPIEQYRADHVEALAGICRAGFGEVEVHLHHADDTEENLRATLSRYKRLLARRHGLLATDRRTGELVYGFVHGNWALAHSHPSGEWCGVRGELRVLRETGCYADFTMPSAPDPTQPARINSLYYTTGDGDSPSDLESGIDVGAGEPPDRALMLIQGPLLIDWNRRKWGIVPRIENGCVQGSHPASLGRLDLWLKARVQVPSRPDWYFVKLHAHGAMESCREALLGEPMVRFHRDLAHRAAEDPDFHFHYVTAREMYNLAKAAEAGWTGPVDAARDFQLHWNGGRTAGRPSRAAALYATR